MDTQQNGRNKGTVMKSIAFIPHKQRIAEHKVDYLRAIADAMDDFAFSMSA